MDRASASEAVGTSIQFCRTAYDFGDLSYPTTMVEHGDEMEEVNIDDEITLDLEQDSNNQAKSKKFILLIFCALKFLS